MAPSLKAVFYPAAQSVVTSQNPIGKSYVTSGQRLPDPGGRPSSAFEGFHIYYFSNVESEPIAQ
ncbi:hypothetical protein QP229_12955, partial [Streptococcus agalactiae]|nr:hypothetical protein [Streptococcus agalactiae]